MGLATQGRETKTEGLWETIIRIFIYEKICVELSENARKENEKCAKKDEKLLLL